MLTSRRSRFSILPPKSILADTASGNSERPKGSHARADSLLVETDRYQSLAGAVDRDGDTESIFSDFNQPRGVRTFSPQPIRRHPTDVVIDPDSLIVNSDGAEAAGAAREGGQQHQNHQEEEEDEIDDSSHWRDEIGLRNEGSVSSQGDESTATMSDVSAPKDKESGWNGADEEITSSHEQ
jgi:hypothetical protein